MAGGGFHKHPMKTIQTLVAALLLLATAGAGRALANGPAYDSSGNGNLNGTYYFRQVLYIIGDQSGDITRGIALNGSLQFNGDGTYTMLQGASVYDDNNGQESSE